MDADILTLAGTVSGAGEAEQKLLEALCSAARQRWELRLRQGVTAEDCGTAFVCAVAFTAAADLMTGGRSGGEVASFTAGEISVKTASAAERSGSAETLRQTAERLMAPYAEADDFSFKGVRG